MQMLFSGFPTPSGNQQHQSQHAGGPQPLPANPTVRGVAYPNQGSPLSTPSTSASRGMSTRDAGIDSSTVRASVQAAPPTYTTHPPNSRPLHSGGLSPSPSSMQPQFQMPFTVQGGAPWPTWGDGSPMTSYSTANVLRADVPPVQTTGPMVPAGSNMNLANELDTMHIAPWEESKRTRQRRLQRLAANAYNLKSSKWPMKIDCTADGAPDPKYRIFVHRVFRMAAKRFLDLSLIKFRDQSDNDIQLVRQDIDMHFTFTPPLREGYVMWHLEDAMRSSRYQWRNHWKNTGRGERHPQCPPENFPSLAKYWVTSEAEEESRREKLHREEVRNARRILLGLDHCGNVEEVQNARQFLIQHGDADPSRNCDSNLTWGVSQNSAEVLCQFLNFLWKEL